MADNDGRQILKVGEETLCRPTVGEVPGNIDFTPEIPDNFIIVKGEQKKINTLYIYELTLRAEKPGDCEVAVDIRLNGNKVGSTHYSFHITP